MLKASVFAVLLGGAFLASNVLAAGQADAMCPKVGEIAELIMDHRQKGTAISALRAAILSNPDNPVNELAATMILDAYDTPRYSTEANKATAKVDFRNEMELACYRTME